MKPDRRPQSDFDRIPETPVHLKPATALEKQRASIYGADLNHLLEPCHASAELFGSTDLGIATKGEWEFAIYLTDEQWYPVLICLINHFGSIYFLRDDLAVFTDKFEDNDIEIIPMRAETAQRNQSIMHYWRNHPAALKEYEQGKLEHAFSRREYYRWKDEYIAQIVEKL